MPKLKNAALVINETTPQTHHAVELAMTRYKNSLSLKPASFLSLEKIAAGEMKNIIKSAHDMKKSPNDYRSTLKNKSVALLFQKTSTRTRCSFENAVNELGGFASYIDWRTSNFVLADLQDEIKVLSRYYNLIMARVMHHETLATMAAHSEVPIINGLCNLYHPCQALSDFMTMTEYFGINLNGLRVAYIGDGNNVCRSLAHGAIHMGVELTLCSPKGYKLDAATIASGHGSIVKINDPYDAVWDADVIYTDTWISMGDEAEAQERLAAFQDYQITENLFEAAPKHALFMHCLPAHPGQEVAPEVLRGPRSIVLDQAENRKHAQKALMAAMI